MKEGLKRIYRGGFAQFQLQQHLRTMAVAYFGAAAAADSGSWPHRAHVGGRADRRSSTALADSAATYHPEHVIKTSLYVCMYVCIHPTMAADRYQNESPIFSLPLVSVSPPTMCVSLGCFSGGGGVCVRVREGN